MSNMFLYPFMRHEKTAGRNGGIDKLASALIAGDYRQVEPLMSEEDHAFQALSRTTREKLASGIPLTARDVNSMGETEIAALTLLGDDAMAKTAAYMEFYNDASMAEAQGRNLARAVVGQEKVAQAEDLLLAQKLASHPAFLQKLASRARRELIRRRSRR